jgi:phosphomevalonate kinase
VIWTGVPASTEAQLSRLAGQAARPSRSALLLAAPRICEAWRSGDAGAILAEYVGYIGVLRQFSVDHDLGIFDAGHDELTDAAMVDGLVYKPAGAGGGDVGILFGRNDAELDAFLKRRADLVCGVLPCELEQDGVRLEAR